MRAIEPPFRLDQRDGHKGVLEIQDKRVDVHVVWKIGSKNGEVDAVVDTSRQNLPFGEDDCVVDTVGAQVLDEPMFNRPILLYLHDVAQRGRMANAVQARSGGGRVRAKARVRRERPAVAPLVQALEALTSGS